MKYIVIVGDGMADSPIRELDGKTPLEVANKPNMDFIAREGRCGLLKTLSRDMPLGSDIANLSLLGYDPKEYYPGGRGPLEAAAMNVSLERDDIALRCNLITEDGGILRDYSGGHISSEEAKGLIEFIDKRLGGEKVEFYPGVGYRHLLILRDFSVDPRDIICKPPHDIMGQEIEKNLIKPGSKEAKSIVDMLNDLMKRSNGILNDHPINKKRINEKKPPANMLWFWGAGKKPRMPKFQERFGLKGALISAVDLLRGIAIYLGLEVIDVPGATGYLDTNYDGKAEYALGALESNDLVYVHIEAPDEAGHEGNIREKIKAIEAIDEKIVGRILSELDGKEFSIAILPDHATPIEVRTHTLDPVPFAIYSTLRDGDPVEVYNEKAAAEGFYGIRNGTEFMNLLIKRNEKND
ncbi:MAG: cofactor-independent phosphoglycerate mutase [Candidatus Altiarchaeales archaeon]|nr:MAG: cofactor-independent phosphoglycerate mutase [Candidatus Altiarchaeales archaeon]